MKGGEVDIIINLPLHSHAAITTETVDFDIGEPCVGDHKGLHTLRKLFRGLVGKPLRSLAL